MNEVAASVVAALSKVDNATREKIKKEVFDLIDRKYPDTKAALDYGAIIITGQK